MYLFLAILFFATVLSSFLVIACFIFKYESRLRIVKFYFLWLAIYCVCIVMGTGPEGPRLNKDSHSSPYKLPWKSGVSRFVSQGNRSFTSHREMHLFAWDFWMAIGTEVLAARAGKVIRIEQSYDGIGLDSNYVIIEHDDGSRAMYAHIKKDGSVVTVDQLVRQGQVIAYSGMVGQTVNPHLHFVVWDKTETTSLPVTFSDVPDGVPLAGRFYLSGNGD